MGLFFGKKKDTDSGSGEMVRWLNKVDQAYQRSFQVKNATGLAPYLTRTCLMQVQERVRFEEQAYQGLSRYRHIKWVKGNQEPNSTCYIKQITYDQVRMSHGIVVPVGDEGSESWKIITENGENKIAEIRRVG